MQNTNDTYTDTLTATTNDFDTISDDVLSALGYKNEFDFIQAYC